MLLVIVVVWGAVAIWRECSSVALGPSSAQSSHQEGAQTTRRHLRRGPLAGDCWSCPLTWLALHCDAP